ncbi:MAG: tetratricopeptide repeat protein [Gammaproteobacteria bacterium]
MSDINRAISITDRLLAWDLLDSAASVLETSLESHPYNPELLRRLGKVRLAQGLPQDAIPYLKLAMQQDQMRVVVGSGDPRVTVGSTH